MLLTAFALCSVLDLIFAKEIQKNLTKIFLFMVSSVGLELKAYISEFIPKKGFHKNPWFPQGIGLKEKSG